MEGWSCWGVLRWTGQVLWQAEANHIACLLPLPAYCRLQTESGLQKHPRLYECLCTRKRKDGNRQRSSSFQCWHSLYRLGTTIHCSTQTNHHPFTVQLPATLSLMSCCEDILYCLCLFLRASVIEWLHVYLHLCVHMCVHLHGTLVLRLPPIHADYRQSAGGSLLLAAH